MREDRFQFWMPLRKTSTDAEGKRWIEGIASDEDPDLQGEQVVQKGLDVEYFARHGFFNWDHQDVVAVKGGAGEERLAIGKIGEPTVARMTDRGLFVRGFLYQGNALADAAWELAQSLERSGASRRLGFSIQGKTLRKQGNRILKAWIQDVAITPAPVNPRTYLDVVKGLSTTPDELGKALSTGYERTAETTEGDGAPLRPESLEGQPACRFCGAPPDGETRGERVLDRGQAVRLLQLDKGYSRATAELAVDLLFRAAALEEESMTAAAAKEMTP